MLHRKLYLLKIKLLEAKIKELGILIEQERRASNEEEQEIRNEMLNKQNLYLKQIDEIKGALQSKEKTDPTIGQKFTIEQGGIEREVVLVVSSEADPSKNFISTTSPLGQALHGKLPGELVTIITPQGEASYVIKSKRDFFGKL